MRSPTRIPILSAVAVLGISLTAVVGGPAPSASADPDGSFSGIEPRAQICDAAGYFSPYLNGDVAQDMPNNIQVTINSATANPAAAVAGLTRVRVASTTPLAKLNLAVQAASATPRTFYFEAETYNYSDPIVVNQKVTLLGTRTKANNTSASGNRTTLFGGNVAGKLTAITATGTNANYVEIGYLTIRDYGRDPSAGLATAPVDNAFAVNSNGGYGWYLHNSRVLRAESGGVRLGSKSYLQDNCLQTNGRYAFSEFKAFDVQFVHNEVVDNGSAYRITAPDSGDHGAMKVFASRKVQMRKNWVHANFGPGIWFDTNNSDVVINQNWVEANYAQGIFYELSYNAAITYNAVIGNNVTRKGDYANNTSPSQAGIFISNSGAAQLVGGPSRTNVAGDATLGVNNTFSVGHNWLEDNKFAVTLFQNAKRFCGSDDESSRGYCTLTGGRREVAGAATKQVDFANAAAIGWTSDLTALYNDTDYTSCMYVPFTLGTPSVATPSPDGLRAACFWNTNKVTLSNTSLVVDPSVPQESLIVQQATTGCPYGTSPACKLHGQHPTTPDTAGTSVDRSTPWGSSPTFILDKMTGENGGVSAPEKNVISGTVWRAGGSASTAYPTSCPSMANAVVIHSGTANAWCTSYF